MLHGMIFAMKISYKTNNNIVYSCKYHIVWCTKYRKSLLSFPIDQSLKGILLQVARDTRSDLIELEVMPDHVHILIEIDPQYGISAVIKKMKGRSSKLLRENYSQLKKLPALWTNSYFVSTVGGAPLQIVKQYIENQKYV
jgi:putative transposase